MKRIVWRLVLAVAALAALAAGIGGIASAEPAGPPQQRVFTVHEKQWSFTPSTIVVNRGDRVVLNLVSDDVTHGFYLDGYGIEKAVPVEQPAQVSFVADRAGRFMYRCSVTCGPFHPYMIGWLVVRPDNTALVGWGAAAATGLGFIGFLLKAGWVL